MGWAKRHAGVADSRRFGDYQPTRTMHEGEKASVYQARRAPKEGGPPSQDLYAVKLYKPDYNRTARRIRRRYKLQTEGQMGRLLMPPQRTTPDDFPIVRTFDDGQEHNNPALGYYVVLEYVEGSNLKRMIGCDEPLLREKRVQIARDVTLGLALIHEKGFIHRDVCSDNVLVRPDGHAKLIDLGFMAPLGIAFREKSGTPSYMSPEQFQVRPLNEASDIYSLGIVLFEIFTGKLPFTSAVSMHDALLQVRRASDLMHQHLRVKPVLTPDMLKAMPAGMDRIILGCLEKKPEQRYPTARHLLNDLTQIKET